MPMGTLKSVCSYLSRDIRANQLEHTLLRYSPAGLGCQLVSPLIFTTYYQKWLFSKECLVPKTMAYYYYDLSLVHGLIFIVPCIILSLFKLWTKIIAKTQAEILSRKLNEEFIKLV